jgi:glutamine synthetase type III
MVMELMEEIAAKHGLVCLLNEKPFKARSRGRDRARARARAR